jgi:hypothetical protein
MTTYFQASNQNYLALPGNGGILLASANVLEKNRGEMFINRVRYTINESLAALLKPKTV